MKQTIEGLQVANKTVFVRVDFNVPMKDGVITDDTRIRSALPTINYLIEKGAKVILASHFGRPKGERKPEMSLAPCAKHLSELINKPVAFVDDCIGPKVEEAVKALQSGDVDMAISIGPGEYSIFQNDKKFTIYEVASLRDVFVRIGQKGKLQNPNLRAALIAAADRESYAKNLMKDTFVAGKAPLPPSIDYGFNQLRDPNKYNVERAKELLKREGYEDTNGDGIVDKDGENLVLDFYAYTTRPELPLYAEALQADYKKIGVDLRIKIVDYAVIDTLSQSGDYDMIISSVVTANTGQPVWFLKQYWGTGVETNGSGFSNPRFDELLALGESSSDPVVRRNAVINAQQLMLDNAVALFLGYPKINIVGNKHIDGIKITPSEYYIITKDLKKK